MPKQIVVANKSRAQKVKVHFRQSPFPGRAKKQDSARCSVTSDMGRVWSAKQSFHRECEVYDLPGNSCQVTYSSARQAVPGLRRKPNQKIK